MAPCRLPGLRGGALHLAGRLQRGVEGSAPPGAPDPAALLTQQPAGPGAETGPGPQRGTHNAQPDAHRHTQTHTDTHRHTDTHTHTHTHTHASTGTHAHTHTPHTSLCASDPLSNM